MKRILSVILMVTIVLLLCSACSNSGDEIGTATKRSANMSAEEVKKELTLLSNDFMDEFIPYLYYGDNKAEVDTFMASSYSIDDAGLTIANSMLKERLAPQLSDWLVRFFEIGGEECTQEWIDETLQICVYDSLLEAAMNKSGYSVDSINVGENSAEVNVSVDVATNFNFATDGMKMDPIAIKETTLMVRSAFKGLNYDDMVVVGQKILTIDYVLENGEWKINQVMF